MGIESVQEIAQRGDQVPETYIVKEGLIPEAMDAPPHLWTDTLLLDFSLLSSSSPDELAKLRSASSQWGCFQVINHGIESSLLEDLIEVSEQFFALPLKEKLKSSAPGQVYQGYGSVPFGPKSSLWNDGLILVLQPEEGRMLDIWPKKPHHFREILLEYSAKVSKIVEGILKAMARSLNLEDTNCFWDVGGKHGTLSTKINYYPPCPCPERVLGARPHSDISTVTTLIANKDSEGLHVQKDDQWFKVSLISGALFINLGDFAEIMTNGICKSSVHRVVPTSSKERLSVVLFSVPNGEAEIGPMNELVSANEPQLYKRFKVAEYFKQSFKSTALGNRTHLMLLSSNSN